MRRWERLKRWMGYQDCPVCGELVRFRFHQAYVVFEDEPPLFGQWQCPECDAMTDVLPTKLSEDAVKSLGYKDFNDYYEKVIKPKQRGVE